MAQEVQTIQTRFGDFQISEDDVLTFRKGLPGFEQCRRFVLLSHETFGPLRCLHATDGTEATFLAVDPRDVIPDYTHALRSEEQAQVKAEEDTPLVWLALLTFSDDDAPSANLRAPIVINPASMLGCQVIVEDERYTVRHRLVA